MTYPSMQPIPPVAAETLAEHGVDEKDSEREVVGASDADADAARSGRDVDFTGAERDSDGVPVGEDDVEADVERSS